MLDQEEYIEQAYFFRVLSERLGQNEPMQELFRSLREEVLSTTKLPIAVDYMYGELKHSGCFGPAMAKLGHYFSPYQTFVVCSAEEETGRFDMRVAINILRYLAEFLAKEPSLQAVFLYQFEVLCRNRLRYEHGLDAMSKDPIYTPEWRDWITDTRRQLGILGLGEMIYVRSEQYMHHRRSRESADVQPEKPILFGEKEGKIALANRKRDPLLLFAALQRHLGYPSAPRMEKIERPSETLPLMIRRMERLEQRIKLLEEEQQGGIDITKYYNPDSLPDGRSDAS